MEFVATPADGLCCVWCVYPALCWYWCREVEASSIDWIQLSKLLPEDGGGVQSQKHRFLDYFPYLEKNKSRLKSHLNVLYPSYQLSNA